MKPYPFATKKGNLSIYGRGLVLGESLWGNELVDLWDMLEEEGTPASAELRFPDGDFLFSRNSHATTPHPQYPGIEYIPRLAFDFSPNGSTAKVYLDKQVIGSLSQTKQPGYMAKYWPRLPGGRDIFDGRNGKAYESYEKAGIALAMRTWP